MDCVSPYLCRGAVSKNLQNTKTMKHSKRFYIALKFWQWRNITTYCHWQIQQVKMLHLAVKLTFKRVCVTFWYQLIVWADVQNVNQHFCHCKQQMTTVYYQKELKQFLPPEFKGQTLPYSRKNDWIIGKATREAWLLGQLAPCVPHLSPTGQVILSHHRVEVCF